ncbi:MAG: hypothetical protein DHS20C18_10770 [Saprospiraceae bacterium]|nr:MAG: hypothetical protein DHS20C18_10770 [Saprospiraceae bacterium]
MGQSNAESRTDIKLFELDEPDAFPQPPEESANQKDFLFDKITGGVGALVNDMNGGASIDLASFTVKYLLPVGLKSDTISVKTENGAEPVGLTQRYRYISLYLINRAAISTDSSNTLANEYLTSLQGTPVTFRLAYEGFLTKSQVINEVQMLPMLKYKFSGDARVVPFNNASGIVTFGGSLNLYFSLLAHFRGIQIDHGKIKDQGTFYIEPSIGFAIGNQEMMETIVIDKGNKLLFSTELRFGFLSDKNRIQDWGVLVRYTWEDINGPNFRIGLTVTPQ